MNAEVEPRAEAQPAQDAQIILLKSPVGIADRADQLLREVLLALKGIAPFVADGMIGDGVDREVASRQVVHEGHAEFHDGMPAVGLDVLTEGCDLVRLIGRIEDRDGPMRDADGHRALEQLLHLGRRGRGREVEVAILEPQEVVANGTADTPRLEPCVFELLGNLQDFGGNRELRRERHPQRTEPPFTLRISPVICLARLEHKKTTGPATSSALATRRSGIVFSIAARPSPA